MSSSVSTVLQVARASAWARRSTLAWVLLSIALATALLLTLERLREDVRASFLQAVSGTDLVVGARTGSLQLMLNSVFHIGGATHSMSVASVQALAQHRAVAWVLPLSLGDSYRGFPVLGTQGAYFEQFKYGEQQSLSLQQGRAFAGNLDGLYEAVVGAQVAERLGLKLGSTIKLAHGMKGDPDHDHDHDHHGHGDKGGKHDQGKPEAAATAGAPSLAAQHDDKPFTVVGVLARTGTPVDRTVHVSLQAIEAIHLEWAGGAPPPKDARIPAEGARKFDLQPKQVSAALVGLKSRAAVFVVQRFVNEYPGEALMAVLPAAALDELWSVVGVGEQALLLISALVAAVSLAGLVAVVLASLNERRRELAVLRAVGAGPRQVLLLLAAEGALVALAGVIVGVVLAFTAITAAGPWLQARFGVSLQSFAAPSTSQWAMLGAILVAGLLASLWPGWRAYRYSLADGLQPRV